MRHLKTKIHFIYLFIKRYKWTISVKQILYFIFNQGQIVQCLSRMCGTIIFLYILLVTARNNIYIYINTEQFYSPTCLNSSINKKKLIPAATEEFSVGDGTCVSSDPFSSLTASMVGLPKLCKQKG